MTQICNFRNPKTMHTNNNKNQDQNRIETNSQQLSQNNSLHRRNMRQLNLGSGSSDRQKRVRFEDVEVGSLVPVYGAMSIAGRSRVMEDEISVKTDISRPMICMNRPVHFFAVFDGHGGPHVSALCKEKMHVFMEEELSRMVVTDTVDTGVGSSSCPSMKLPKLSETEEKAWWRLTMEKCFERMNEVAVNTCRCGRFGFECGCSEVHSALIGSTAVVAVLTANHYIVANCGDSRAVLCRRGGMSVPLSFDHKPERQDELARIIASGGQVIEFNGVRVGGILAMSRAIGDKYLKPAVTYEPEVTITKRNPEDECLILASDGLWDVMSNELVCQVASECLGEGTLVRATGEREGTGTSGTLYESRSASAAVLLTRLALGRKSEDNISVIVVDLKRSA